MTRKEANARDALIDAAMACDAFFRDMVKVKSWELSDMSEWELELMRAAKALRAARRKPRATRRAV